MQSFNHIKDYGRTLEGYQLVVNIAGSIYHTHRTHVSQLAGKSASTTIIVLLNHHSSTTSICLRCDEQVISCCRKADKHRDNEPPPAMQTHAVEVLYIYRISHLLLVNRLLNF